MGLPHKPTSTLLQATNAVVDAVNRIPLVSTFLEIVGLGVTGWGVYRYLLFRPDRCAQPLHRDSGFSLNPRF